MDKCPKNNPECVKHTPIVHGATCTLKGKNKCVDVLNIKECWTSEDIKLLSKILEDK